MGEPCSTRSAFLFLHLLFADASQSDMENRDQKGDQVQSHTDKYDLADLLHTAEPPPYIPVEERWEKNGKRFNMLDCPQPRGAPEQFPKLR